MKASPLVLALFYFSFGVLLVYLAIVNVAASGWNFWTYLIIAFATMDFMMVFRIFSLRKAIKKAQNEQKDSEKD